MPETTLTGLSPILCMLLCSVTAQARPEAPVKAADDSEARPPVTAADVRIAQRTKGILDSPAKWNRSDNRVCPKDACTFSLYCAIEKATEEVSGTFEHRGAAMQEARLATESPEQPKAGGKAP